MIAALVLVAATLTVSGVAAAGPVHHRFWQPMLNLPKSVRATFACIMWRESRSTFAHLNLGDNNRFGSSGIFQIEEQLWSARSGFHFPVWVASPYEQELGAVRIWRVDGFGPWRSDGCF